MKVGFVLTVFVWVSIVVPGISDEAIRPVPWITEGAISFLEVFLEKHPSAKILEFGSGASTIWFAKKHVRLYSVEHHMKWYEKINNLLKNYNSVNYFLHSLPYYEFCDKFPDEFFDLILIDGRNRKGCIQFSLPKLKKGGVLMLDNAERSYYFSVFERMSGWLRFDALQEQPDSCGFHYPGWLTSWWVKPE
ncbi:MAG: class I SAM-dependent methyltransferase [Simkaniaceae bacterium]|nr:class I SAM-dependent methyltransferase [Simkaniaceae bacterium]